MKHSVYQLLHDTTLSQLHLLRDAFEQEVELGAVFVFDLMPQDIKLASHDIPVTHKLVWKDLGELIGNLLLLGHLLL